MQIWFRLAHDKLVKQKKGGHMCENRRILILILIICNACFASLKKDDATDEDADEERDDGLLYNSESESGDLGTVSASNEKRFPPVFTNAKNKLLKNFFARPAGSSVKLTCPNKSNPPAKITWLKDNETLSARRMEGLMGPQLGYIYRKWSLRIDHLTEEDSGDYTCVVYNSEGSVNHTFIVEVHERIPHKPIIREGFPSNQTVYVGGRATFECRFISDLMPNVKWVKHYEINGSYASSNDKPYVEVLHSSDPNVTDAQFLILDNVTLDDAGWISCLAANLFGVSYRSAYLTVLPNPEENASELIMAASKDIYSLDTLIIVVISITGTAIIFIALLSFLKRARNKTKKINAPSHIIIKKKVVFERQDSNNSEASIIPLVKIDGARNNLCVMSTERGVSEYILPIDPVYEFPRERLLLGKHIGSGAFGEVFKAEAFGLNGKDGPTVVAVKKLKAGHTDEEMADLVSEMEMLKVVGKHINIISLLGCCSQDGPLYVIFEYADTGNLRDFLRAHRPASGYEVAMGASELKMTGTLTEKKLLSIAYQVARGMEFLSSKKFIHRDLAARNVLITKEHVVKIADFGLSKAMHYADYYKKKSKGGRLPIKWLAPECLLYGTYSTFSDVWSFGILMWEIMTLGGTPYPSVQTEKLYSLLKAGHRMQRPEKCSLEIYMIMMGCWQEEPLQRPPFGELMEDLDRILMTSSEEAYLELDVPVLDNLPSSWSESDSDTLSDMENEPPL